MKVHNAMTRKRHFYEQINHFFESTANKNTRYSQKGLLSPGSTFCLRWLQG